MFTILLPKTLPIAIPTDSSFAILKTAITNSGNEVERAIRIKPITVFPKLLSLQFFYYLLLSND